MCVRFKISALLGVRVTYRRWMVFSIIDDFCQNEGEVIESEDETSSYESKEDQEQVGCRYFFIKVLFEPGLCNNY